MPSTVVVVNPRSAGGKTERRWPQLRQIIHEAYGPFEERFTQAPGDGITLARDALKSGAELVVALGGDGTINEMVRLTLDGRPPKDGKIYTVAVANGRYFGGGMKVAPEARLDDGLFDVVTLGDFGFGDLLFRGLDIYSGKHVTNPKVTVHRARRVEATPENGVEVLLDVDGEQPGRLPDTFELLPQALTVRGC